MTSAAATAASSAHAGVSAASRLNVLGAPLGLCCSSPATGFWRDGFCVTGPSDAGRHVVCAVVTDDFLAFTRSRGNDLQTPHLPSFPGLRAGDKWCLCASRWAEALRAGVAPPVDLNATSAAALRFVTLDELKAHAVEPSLDELKAHAVEPAGGEGAAGAGGGAAAGSDAAGR